MAEGPKKQDLTAMHDNLECDTMVLKIALEDRDDLKLGNLDKGIKKKG